LNRPLIRIALVLASLASASSARAQDTIPPADSLAADTIPADGARPVRVCAGGDVTLGSNLDTTWVHAASQRLGRRVAAFPDPDSLLAPLRPLVADADVVLLNVEAAIGEGPPGRRKCAPGSTQCYAFRSPPAAAGALRRVAEHAQVVGNVANNHARDAGDTGWRETARRLEAEGVGVTGMDTLATVVETAAGDSVAFLGFSPWTGPDPRRLDAVRRHVRRAAARWPYVVVTMHMGAEGTRAQRTPNAVEVAFGEDRGNSVAFARAAVEAGADAVFGHGPHVMRAAEWHRGALIFYSLGNLVTYGPFSFGGPLSAGGIACASLAREGGVEAAELRSTRQRAPGLVEPDPTGAAAALVRDLSRLDFPDSGPHLLASGEVQRVRGGEASSAPAVTSPRRQERRRPKE
jgi:Bacterial capsule synthesis protein PGA_cap